MAHINTGVPVMDLRKLREKAGISQAELAKAIGVVPSAIGNYENGYRRPSIEQTGLIIRALKQHGVNVSIEDIFGQTAA